MRVLVTGSSGLIGTSLVTSLRAHGHHAEGLHRGERKGDGLYWSPKDGTIDAIEGFDAVVHLAGAGIGNKRWSDSYKRTILESRTKGTRLLADALAKSDSPPAVLVSGSAIGFYGNRGDEVLTEASDPGDDFLAKVCVAWEKATQAAETAGIRVVHVRTGIVLDDDGGALSKLLLPFKLGVGGRLGSGEQWWSWISLADEVAAIEYLVMSSTLSGPVNLTAPNPARNAQFVKTLGEAMHRPALLPTPAFALKLLLGPELAQALLFNSARVHPHKLMADGFEFTNPRLDGALQAAL